MRCALQDEVRHAAGAQVLAHRQAGLASADDEDLNLLARHTNLHSERQTRLFRCALCVLESSVGGNAPVQQMFLTFKF